MAVPCSPDTLSQRAFLADVFHELSQPLTALHCLLELSLQRDTTADDFRASLHKALDNTDRLRQRLVLMRAIYHADQPGFAGATADLNGMLRELGESMLPLFVSAGQQLQIEVSPSALVVKGDRGQLITVLFCCLEFLQRYSEDHAVVQVAGNVSEDRFAEICIHSQASVAISMPGAERRDANSFEFELARRTFRAAGGDFTVVLNEPSGCTCRGTLPLA